MEGLEETLTLHRLGLFEELGRTFKTTNSIENVNGLLGPYLGKSPYLGKVKHWMHSDQRQRWVGIRQDPLGLLEVEQRMRRIDNYGALSKLRKVLQQHVEQHQQQAAAEPSSE